VTLSRYGYFYRADSWRRRFGIRWLICTNGPEITFVGGDWMPVLCRIPSPNRQDRITFTVLAFLQQVRPEADLTMDQFGFITYKQ
jgi:hypothetical protein